MSFSDKEKHRKEQLRHDFSVKKLSSILSLSENFEFVTSFFRYNDEKGIKREIDIIAKKRNEQVIYAFEVKNGMRICRAEEQLGKFERCSVMGYYNLQLRKFFYSHQGEADILIEIKDRKKYHLNLDSILH